MDHISITDLDVYAYHGVFPEEKKLGQHFYLSLSLSIDAHRAGVSDSLQDSVNYGDVCHTAKKELEEHSFHLIEAAL